VFSNKTKEQQKIDWGLRPDDIVVGYIGRWSGEKNPLALGKVISALPEEFKGVYVGVVRDGPWS
jgi:glycosyltransferase involved in cell wall biosynthesis